MILQQGRFVNLLKFLQVYLRVCIIWMYVGPHIFIIIYSSDLLQILKQRIVRS